MDVEAKVKNIVLEPGPVLSNRMEIAVMDFLDEVPRKRCKITVDYGRADALELKDKGMNLDEAMEHYREYIYKLVKFHILSEWEADESMNEVLDIVRERIEVYFQ